MLYDMAQLDRLNILLCAILCLVFVAPGRTDFVCGRPKLCECLSSISQVICTGPYFNDVGSYHLLNLRYNNIPFLPGRLFNQFHNIDIRNNAHFDCERFNKFPQYMVQRVITDCNKSGSSILPTIFYPNVTRRMYISSKRSRSNRIWRRTAAINPDTESDDDDDETVESYIMGSWKDFSIPDILPTDTPVESLYEQIMKMLSLWNTALGLGLGIPLACLIIGMLIALCCCTSVGRRFCHNLFCCFLFKSCCCYNRPPGPRIRTTLEEGSSTSILFEMSPQPFPTPSASLRDKSE